MQRIFQQFIVTTLVSGTGSQHGQAAFSWAQGLLPARLMVAFFFHNRQDTKLLVFGPNLGSAGAR